MMMEEIEVLRSPSQLIPPHAWSSSLSYPITLLVNYLNGGLVGLIICGFKQFQILKLRVFIFSVGNIPYEASEEQLKEIFSEVGPVVSFRSAEKKTVQMYFALYSKN